MDLAAPVAQVWQAISDHQEFGEWFRVRLDGPFQLGATTTGRMTTPGHEHVEWVSVTEQIVPERVLSFSWHPSALDPDTDYDEDAKVLVEFHLQPTEKGTRLKITESGFRHFPEPIRLNVLRSIEEGWDAQAKNIATHVYQ